MDMKFKKTQMEKCMVKKMNKEKFINKLIEKLNIDKNTAIMINNIFENYFIIDKKNKDKIVNDLMNELKIDLEKAESIYEKVMDLITTTIKNKIKHPFRKD